MDPLLLAIIPLAIIPNNSQVDLYIAMFGSSRSQMSPSKAFVSIGRLPRLIDPQQPPSKKQPFSAIMNQPFTHTVDDCSLKFASERC